MRFWKLGRPFYDQGDYSDSFINGVLEHPFGLPGIECEVCRQTWGGSRVLPIECPDSLRKKKHFLERWPISNEQHEAVQAELRLELKIRGITAAEFRPGDDLQPCYFDVPSRPEADFLWPGLYGPVVSERVKVSFEDGGVKGVVFCPVTLRKVGTRRATSSPPIPTTGEPEDIINEVSLAKTHTGIDPYFEMLVLPDLGYPPGGKPKSVCRGCGREEIDRDSRRLVMTEEMWTGDAIFRLATTLYLIVTNDLKERIMRLRPANIAFTELAS